MPIISMSHRCICRLKRSDMRKRVTKYDCGLRLQLLGVILRIIFHYMRQSTGFIASLFVIRIYIFNRTVFICIRKRARVKAHDKINFLTSSHCIKQISHRKLDKYSQKPKHQVSISIENEIPYTEIPRLIPAKAYAIQLLLAYIYIYTLHIYTSRYIYTRARLEQIRRRVVAQ